MRSDPVRYRDYQEKQAAYQVVWREKLIANVVKYQAVLKKQREYAARNCPVWPQAPLSKKDADAIWAAIQKRGAVQGGAAVK